MTLPLLIVRPEPGASATAAKALALGLHVIRYPLFEIRPCAWDPPDPSKFDALMLTSANTLRHGGEELERYRHLPAYAVGEATAAIARKRGFCVVAAGGSGAQAVSGLIAMRGHARVLHPGAHDRRPFDSGPLAVTHVTVYASVGIGDAKGLRAVLPDDAVVLLHSPRAAERLARFVPFPERQRLHLAAISPAALDAAGAGWASGAAAANSSDEALLVLAAALCKEGRR